MLPSSQIRWYHSVIVLLLIFILYFGYREELLKAIVPMKAKLPMKIKSAGDIPPLVHFVYLNAIYNNSMVVNYRQCISSCLDINRNLTFVLWTDWNAELFVNKFYPNTSTDNVTLAIRKIALNRNMVPTMRSDIWRYLIMKQFGGIYMDLDTICQKPMYHQYFSSLVGECVVGNDAPIQTKIIFDMEFIVSPNFLAAPPNHKLMDILVRGLPDLNLTGAVPWYTTGPAYISQKLKKLLGVETFNYTDYILGHTKLSTAKRMGVLFTNASYFHPNVNENPVNSICKNPGPKHTWRYRGCQQLQSYYEWYKKPNGGRDNAVLLTVYEHLGHSNLKGRDHFLPFSVFPRLHYWPPNVHL